MPSLRDRRRFAYHMPSLAEAQGDSFDVLHTPMSCRLLRCLQTPQGDVSLIVKKPAASRILPVADLQKSQDRVAEIAGPWEDSECIRVTESDLQRFGGDVDLLRHCAEKRKMKESFTPFPTPTCASGRKLKDSKLPPHANIAAGEPETRGSLDDWRKELAAELRGLQKASLQKKTIGQSAYRLPGVYTMQRELDVDVELPPKLPAKKFSASAAHFTNSWPPATKLNATERKHGRSGRPNSRSSSLPTRH